MLCSLCSSINFVAAAPRLSAPQSIHKHHRSFADLVISAKNGCNLCQVLFRHGAQQTVHSRGTAQSACGDELVDLDQIYFATYSTSASHYARLPVYGATEIQFFRQGERFGAKQDGFFVSIELFAQYDSLPAKSGYILGRPIVENPDSKSCYEQIHKWMRECVNNHHAACQIPQASGLLPTRVIDVSPLNNPDLPRILETFGQHGDFIALSHCWGTRTRFVLDSTTRTNLLEGIAMKILPPTFRDAIRVTKALGYRYLWIDSLCILQDSLMDWDHESGRMQEYYTNATLTIALDDIEGDHVGFLDRLRLSDRDAVAVPFRSPEPESGGERTPKNCTSEVVYLSYERGQMRSKLSGGYLGRRGWTLQEDILSVRTIHYGNGRLRWECQEFLGFEGLPYECGILSHLKYNFLRSIGSLITGGYHPTWYNIVETYMQRELTFVNDKFPAISGIAKAVSRRVGFEYRAGIWLEDIHFGLSWFIEGKAERERTYVAPSWSWASMKTPLDGTNQGTKAHHAHNDRPHNSLLKDDPFPMALELIDCEIVPRGKDPFGQITHAVLMLRGHVLEFSKWKPRRPIRVGTSFLLGIDSSSCSIYCTFDEASVTHQATQDAPVDPSSHILENLYLLHIYSTDGHIPVSYLLILMPTTNESQFRRVGLARAETDELKFVGEWDVTDVTII